MQCHCRRSENTRTKLLTITTGVITVYKKKHYSRRGFSNFARKYSQISFSVSANWTSTHIRSAKSQIIDIRSVVKIDCDFHAIGCVVLHERTCFAEGSSILDSTILISGDASTMRKVGLSVNKKGNNDLAAGKQMTSGAVTN